MRGRAGSRIGGVPNFLAQEAITAAPQPSVPGAVYFSIRRTPLQRPDDAQLGSPLALTSAGPSQALTATLYPDTDVCFAPALAQAAIAVPGAVYFSAQRAQQRRRDDQLGSPSGLLAAPAQALAAALYSDADAYFAPSLDPGTVGLSQPAVYTDADALFAPALAPGTVGLTASLYTDPDAYFSPTLVALQAVVPGAVYFSAQRARQGRRDEVLGTPASLLVGTVQALAAGLYTDPDAFLAPTLVPGTVDLAASLYSDPETLFAPAIAAGQVDLTASVYTDADTLFAPTLAAAYGLVAALYSDTEGYFTHALSAEYGLAAALYIEPDTVFAPGLVPGSIDLAPPLYIDGAETLFSPVLAAAGSLVADLYSDPDAFYSAALAGQIVVPGAVYFGALLLVRRAPRLDLLGSPPSLLLAGSAQTLLQVAIHADNDAFFGSTLAGGIQLPGRIGTTTRFMVNLGTMTSRQH
jgi:hypothetical protein